MEGKYWRRQGEPSLSWDVSVSWCVCMYLWVLCVGVCKGRGNMLHYTHLTHKRGEWQAGVGDGRRGEEGSVWATLCPPHRHPFYKHWNPAIKTQKATAKSTTSPITHTQTPISPRQLTSPLPTLCKAKALKTSLFPTFPLNTIPWPLVPASQAPMAPIKWSILKKSVLTQKSTINSSACLFSETSYPNCILKASVFVNCCRAHAASLFSAQVWIVGLAPSFLVDWHLFNKHLSSYPLPNTPWKRSDLSINTFFFQTHSP